MGQKTPKYEKNSHGKSRRSITSKNEGRKKHEKKWKKVKKSDKNGFLTGSDQKVVPLLTPLFGPVRPKTRIEKTEKRVVFGPHFWPKITRFWSIFEQNRAWKVGI